MGNIWFGGVDLSTYGEFSTPKVSGVHDLVDDQTNTFEVPGRDYPTEIRDRPELRTISFTCAIRGDENAADPHADLVNNIQNLKQKTSPRLGWQYLKVVDLSGRQILARSKGFKVDFGAIPYDAHLLQFDLAFLAHPFAETDTDTTISSGGLTSFDVVNPGDVEADAHYVCTVNAALADGLSFTVGTGAGAKTFTYEGALTNGDVLTINTEETSVIRNGSGVLSEVAWGSEFPVLPVGTTGVTLSSSDFDLSISFRPRFE